MVERGQDDRVDKKCRLKSAKTISVEVLRKICDYYLVISLTDLTR